MVLNNDERYLLAAIKMTVTSGTENNGDSQCAFSKSV